MPYPKATSTDLIVAVDMGKNVHWLGCYDGLLNVVDAPRKVRSDLCGFNQMMMLIDQRLASGQFQRVILGYECTGVYHLSWGWQMCERWQQHSTPHSVECVNAGLKFPRIAGLIFLSTNVRP